MAPSLKVLLLGDASHLEKALASTTAKLREVDVAARSASQGGVGKLTEATKGATFNADRLRGGLSTLAAQATGLNPAVAQLTGTLAMMGVGSTLVVGVLAGVGAIAWAFKKAGEETRKYEEDLAKTADRLQGMVEGRAFGGKLDLFRGQLDARTRIAELRGQIGPLEERRAGIAGNPIMVQSIRERRLGELDDQLRPLRAELARWETILKALDDTLQESIPTLDEVEVKFTSLSTRVRELGEPLERVGVDAARAKARLNQAAMEADRAFRGRLGAAADSIGIRTTTQKGTPSSDIATVSRFRDAVDAFRTGVSDMVKGTFSADGLKQVGSQLSAAGIGFLAGKVFDGLSDAFVTSTERLAKAIERNTKALTIRGDTLAGRLVERGLDDEARKILEPIRDVLEGALLGDSVSIKGELEKAGLSLDDLYNLGAALGINLSNLSPDVLMQFIDQVENAVGGLDSLATTANGVAGALRNLPSGFKIALARFNATVPGLGGGSGSGSNPPASLPGNTNTGLNINGPVTIVADDPETFGKKLQRHAARGGSPVLRPAYAR